MAANKFWPSVNRIDDVYGDRNRTAPARRWKLYEMMTIDLCDKPNIRTVPACYDWLSPDRYDWRLQGEMPTHHGLITLMNRQYGLDVRQQAAEPSRTVCTGFRCAPPLLVFRRESATTQPHRSAGR